MVNHAARCSDQREDEALEVCADVNVDDTRVAEVDAKKEESRSSMEVDEPVDAPAGTVPDLTFCSQW